MPSAPPPFDRRIAQIRADMLLAKADSLLVWNRRDQFWLTGFTGEDGGVLLTAKDIVLLTDGRFEETAKLEAPFARALIRKKRSPEITARELKRRKLGRIAFDPAHMSVALFTELSKLIRPAKLVPAPGLIGRRRQIKDAGELDAIRRSIAIADSAMRELLTWLKPGMTEREVLARLIYDMGTRGADEPAFNPVVGFGPAAALPHYAPSDRKISNGSYLLIDWGARAGGYVSDLTRTIPVGTIPADLRRVFGVVRAAHEAAVAKVRPGVKAGAVDNVARQIIAKSGFEKHFNHALGHAIGLDVHEAPRIGKGAKDVLEPGMVITIEPGIYLPGVGGVRLESDVVVTADGGAILESLPLDLSLA